jgi:hypothetical protein
LLPASKGRAEFDVEVAREAGCVAESIGEALDKMGKLLKGDAPKHTWSPHAQTMLHNLNHEAVPILVAETVSVIKERQVTSSSVELPDERRFFRKSAKTHSATKRQPLEPKYVRMVLEECQSNEINKGRIRLLTEEYVVVDPA